ncbi:hypothetical protein Tco_0587722 [Tanacetum coccineum]
MESSVQFICVFCGSLSDEYGCPCSTCELCGNDAHYGYDCPSQVLFVYNQDPCFNQNLDNFPQTSPKNEYGNVFFTNEKTNKKLSFTPFFENNNQPLEEKSIAVLLAEKSILTVMHSLEEKQNDTESMHELLLQLYKDLQTLEPKDSLIMKDEDIDTILEKESSKDNESSAENLVQNPSESETTSDNEKDIDGTNYLIDSIIDFSPKIDHLLKEFAGELALINLIPPGIARADFDPEGDIILEEIDIFLAADDSIPPGIDSDGYDSEKDNPFLEYEPDPGELTRVVVEDIFGEPKVHMPNVLPTHQSLYQDPDFTLSTDFSGSNLVFSFPSKNRNKTFDPGISIEVQSKRFQSLNKFSISFISDPLSPVLETLLPFSSEIEDKVFKTGILVSKEVKSPHLLSHRGFKAFKIIHNFLNENPMMIYEGDMPILDVPYLHFYPP